MAENCDFTMAGLLNRLPEALAKVTAHTCKKIIDDVVKQEDKYWWEDEKLDEKFDSMIEKYEEEEGLGLEYYLGEM